MTCIVEHALRNFAAVLKAVQEREPVTLTRDGEPAADLVSSKALPVSQNGSEFVEYRNVRRQVIPSLRATSYGDKLG